MQIFASNRCPHGLLAEENFLALHKAKTQEFPLQWDSLSLLNCHPHVQLSFHPLESFVQLTLNQHQKEKEENNGIQLVYEAIKILFSRKERKKKKVNQIICKIKATEKLSIRNMDYNLLIMTGRFDSSMPTVNLLSLLLSTNYRHHL